MSMTAAMERAQRGATWLDEVQPDWAERINLSELDEGALAWGDACVAGQALAELAENADEYYANGYVYAECMLGSAMGAIEHGFLEDFDGLYSELLAAWLVLIDERRLMPA